MLTQIITLSSLRCHTKAIRTPKIDSYNQGGMGGISYKGLCGKATKGYTGISLVQVM